MKRKSFYRKRLRTVDHSVDVIDFDDENGNVVSTIVGYACHPHILGPENRLISPDYPGHLRKL